MWQISCFRRCTRSFEGNKKIDTKIADELSRLKAFWDVDTLQKAQCERICVGGADFKNPEVWSRVTEKHLKKITDGVPIKKDWNVLEVGCGLGRLMKPLAKMCKKIDGCDISPNMIKFGNEYHKKDNINFFLTNGYDLIDMSDNTYDFVFSMLTFQHIRSVDILVNYLKEIKRVLKSGGYFKFQTVRHQRENNDFSGINLPVFKLVDILELIMDPKDNSTIRTDKTVDNWIWVLIHKD